MQAIGFMPHRGAQVAYALTGDGPPLLLDLGRAHHLEAFWRHRPYRDFVRELGRHFTVVRWDRPGFGLSDRRPRDLSAAGELALVERLVSRLDAGPVAILGAGAAGPGMLRFAALHTEAVSRLALFGTAAVGCALLPGLPPVALRALTAAPAPALHEVLAAALATGCAPEVSAWLAGALTASADVETMAELVSSTGRADAEGAARRLRTPALVLHRADDPVVGVHWGLALARAIPGSRLQVLPGGPHLAYEGDTGSVLGALVPFLGGRPEVEPARLTARELEVAHLVTLGLTNAEMGRRLAIGRRTVDAHLEHIRAKLRVGSRAGIAAWAVRHAGPLAAGHGA